MEERKRQQRHTELPVRLYVSLKSKYSRKEETCRKVFRSRTRSLIERERFSAFVNEKNQH